MFNILHSHTLVLFKTDALIPSYILLQIFDEANKDRVSTILKSSKNLAEVTDKMRNNNIKYNCIRLDEITHVAGYDPDESK